MSNFPSKWLEFTNHKEIKRLRVDINDTLSLKIQIATSIIITIIGFFLEDYIKKGSLCVKATLCILLSLIVILIFTLPSIIKYFRLRKRCNVIIKGKDAINIFDDEIVYSVLVAYEYYSSRQRIENNDLRQELEKFYDIEIKYYITDAVNKLNSFSASAISIFGDGENKISKERLSNVISMIDTIIEQTGIQVPSTISDDFDIFRQTTK